MVVNTSMGGSDSTSQCKECTLLVTFKNQIRTVVYTIIGITANESGSPVHGTKVSVALTNYGNNASGIIDHTRSKSTLT